MSKKKGGAKNLNPIRSVDEAREKGRKGGIASGKTRRAKRDAKNTIRLFLDMAASGVTADNLNILGVPESEQTNQMALQARMFTSAMGGDLEAYKLLMRYGGYDPEQNRQDRITDAKIKQMSNPPAYRQSPEESEENQSGEDVVIYVPENGRDNLDQDT